MIITPTTFVIGAGASHPYGLPLGGDLISETRALNPGDDVFKILTEVSGKVDRVREFIEDVKATPVRSIDDYLAKRQFNQEVTRIGRAAIAALLARAIATRWRTPKPDQDWLAEIVHWITAGAPTRLDCDEGNKSLRFVTFNFDSIVEDRLKKDLASVYHGRSQDKLPIEDRVIHVHGRLPPLPDHGHPKNPFNRNGLGEIDRRWVEWVESASSKINIVADPIHDQIVRQASEAVSAATVVCFLGFGFFSENLVRLGFPDSFKADSYHHVFGSACGIESGYKEWIQSRFLHRIKLGDVKQNCLDVLKAFYIYRD